MEIPPRSLAGLSLAEKRLLLAQLLQEKANPSPPVFPLSHGQRGLWFLHQLAPESAAYSITRAVRMKSKIDVEALQRAFRALVQRHPALRTTFEQDGEDAVQVVHAEAAFTFVEEDARDWSEHNDEADNGAK